MPNAKAVIVAPFWRQPGHVGNYRVDRFIRWIAERGDEVVVIRGGTTTATAKTAWGWEVTVRDPLGLYPDSLDSTGPRHRRPSPLRRALAYWVFNPDPTIAWARRVIHDRTVVGRSAGAKWVISSSPPESGHVAAEGIARAVRAELIIDLRDGWLDDPLKPVLRNSRLRQWREGPLERRILSHAKRILVTSMVWQQMLQARLPSVADKISVLTNAYPPSLPPASVRTDRNGRLQLLHAGRISGSRSSQDARFLLEPLLSAFGAAASAGTVIFFGNLDPADLLTIERFRDRFIKRGWSLEVRPPVPRDQMLTQLAAADGLLLLSASTAAIPSKVFEYIPTGKPIFAACPRGSAVWQLGQGVPQLFTVDYRRSNGDATTRAFLSACRSRESHFRVPEEYSEQHLKQVFLEQLLP